MFGTHGPGGALIAVALAAVAPAPQAAVQPRMSKDQVIQRARDFCTAIHQPVRGAGQARFPGGFRNHWQARWEVDFAGEATVCVVDATGDIAYYRNRSYDRREGADKPSGRSITETEARQIGSSLVSASGGATDLTFRHAQLMTEADPKVRGSHRWVLDWQRKAGKYLYDRRSGANASLDAEAGIVVTFSKIFPSPPPATLDVRVSKDDAARTGKEKLVAHKLPSGDPVRAELLIVQPNERWLEDPKRLADPRYFPEFERKPESRLAWVFRFNNPDKELYWRDVWVDAETGKVIGGAIGGVPLALPRKGARPPAR